MNINIGTIDEEKLLQIGSVIPPLQQERYRNKFMLGLDPSFVMHNLSLKKDAKPIKQKPRKMHPSKALLVKKEIEKYLNARLSSLLIILSGWLALSLFPSQLVKSRYVLILEISIMHVRRMIFHYQILI